MRRPSWFHCYWVGRGFSSGFTPGWEVGNLLGLRLRSFSPFEKPPGIVKFHKSLLASMTGIVNTI